MRRLACFGFMILFGVAVVPARADKVRARKTSSPPPGLAQLQSMTARFAPTQMRVDTSKLSTGDRQALVKLIEAGRIVDDIFLRQYWSGNPALYSRLQKDKTALGQARLQYFWINKSPWGALDDFRAFLPGVPPEKLKGANFYPEDMTRSEFETWVGSLSKEGQDQAKGFFTVIRRKNDAGAKTLEAVPYSEEYKDELTRAASLLKEAAAPYRQ